jgi:hypothetical protein
MGRRSGFQPLKYTSESAAQVSRSSEGVKSREPQVRLYPGKSAWPAALSCLIECGDDQPQHPGGFQGLVRTEPSISLGDPCILSTTNEAVGDQLVVAREDDDVPNTWRGRQRADLNAAAGWKRRAHAGATQGPAEALPLSKCFAQQGEPLTAHADCCRAWCPHRPDHTTNHRTLPYYAR